jgi:hypothetical protein
MPYGYVLLGLSTIDFMSARLFSTSGHDEHIEAWLHVTATQLRPGWFNPSSKPPPEGAARRKAQTYGIRDP